MPDAAPGLFTIGHSNAALGDVLALLQEHGVQAVADVRTVPRSRYVPHFSAGPLRDALAGRGIGYLPMGRELGGRPEGGEFYDQDGYVLYGRLAATPEFGHGIDQVLAEAQTQRIALLCSEEDPARCHRHLLIGRVLRERGVPVSHLRHDGHTESEAELAARELTGTPQDTLFGSRPAEDQWKSPRVRRVSPGRPGQRGGGGPRTR